MEIKGNTLNGIEPLSAFHTGKTKDGKKEYVILGRYPGEGKFIVSLAFEDESGWTQGHYFHKEYDDSAWKKAKDKFFEDVKYFTVDRYF